MKGNEADQLTTTGGAPGPPLARGESPRPSSHTTTRKPCARSAASAQSASTASGRNAPARTDNLCGCGGAPRRAAAPGRLRWPGRSSAARGIAGMVGRSRRVPGQAPTRRRPALVAPSRSTPAPGRAVKQHGVAALRCRRASSTVRVFIAVWDRAEMVSKPAPTCPPPTRLRKSVCKQSPAAERPQRQNRSRRAPSSVRASGPAGTGRNSPPFHTS